MLLHPVSFNLESGRILGIVGANGAGKSTLLRLIYRYLKPRSGQVLLDGADIWRQSARDVARKIAAVLQEQPTDFALSVLEIVALGRRPHGSALAGAGAHDGELIEDALERMGLSDYRNRSFGTLSGGERQRVMVARALVQCPKLLVLDEPTNHLDIRHQLELAELIRRLGMTIVLSLHDLNLAADLCDEILLLKQGHCVAIGPPGGVLVSDNIEHAYSVTASVDRLMASQKNHLVFRL